MKQDEKPKTPDELQAENAELRKRIAELEAEVDKRTQVKPQFEDAAYYDRIECWAEEPDDPQPVDEAATKARQRAIDECRLRVRPRKGTSGVVSVLKHVSDALQDAGSELEGEQK